MNTLDKKSSSFLDALYIKLGAKIIDYAPPWKFDDWDKKLMFGNTIVTIEEKTRDKDYGDILIELVEDLRTLDPGWIYQTKADKLIYCVLDPRMVYALEMAKVKRYVFDNIKQLLRHCNISDQGYGLTLNVFIPVALGKKIYPTICTL